MAPRKCSECDRLATRKGLCETHYRRMRRNGHTGLQDKSGVDHGDGTRTCSTCKVTKPIGKFPKDPRLASGRRAQCADCGNATRRKRYERDPEKVLDQVRAYRISNPDRARTWASTAYQKHREKYIEWATEAVHRRRALLKDAPSDPGVTVPALRSIHGDMCCYCGALMTFETASEYTPNKATLEHVVPISRGGGNTWENSKLACWECNIRKNGRTVDEWEEVRQNRAENLHPSFAGTNS